jgi:hypothetical protein
VKPIAFEELAGAVLRELALPDTHAKPVPAAALVATWAKRQITLNLKPIVFVDFYRKDHP